MNREVTVNILRNLTQLPKYETEDACGMDVVANIEATVFVQPGCRKLIPTGIKVSLEPGWKINVLPRSGLAYKKGITVLNSPGLIDSDYRGDIGVIIINHGEEAFEIKPGDRIGQIEVAPAFRIVWNEVDSLDDTARGEGGFGSTGK